MKWMWDIAKNPLPIITQLTVTGPTASPIAITITGKVASVKRVNKLSFFLKGVRDAPMTYMDSKGRPPHGFSYYES